MASLFADISTEMIYPVLPIFLTQILKAGGSAVGLVEGVAGATQNVVQGFSGSLSDKLQRRKPIALVGYLLAAIAKPLMGLATVWQGLLGGRFLDRLGPALALPRAMRSSLLQWTRRTEEGRSGSKESATTRAHSWVRCSLSCCSSGCTSTSACSSTSQSFPGSSPS
jgi:MFS family permease